MVGGYQNIICSDTDDLVAMFGSATLSGQLSVLLDLVAATATINYNGSEVFSGAVVVGTGRSDGALFRFGARADSNTSGSTGGAYQLASGEKLGDTDVYVNGSLVRRYVMPTTGSTITDSAGGKTAILRSFPADDSMWEAGSAAFTVTDLVNHRVYQRSGANRSMTISGTCPSGTVAAEVRVMSGATEVVGWTSATIDGTGYEVGLVVPASDSPLTVKARSLDSESAVVDTASGTAEWFVGDVFAMLSSSSGRKWFDTGTGTANAALRMYNESGWQDGGTTGTGALGFASEFVSRAGVAVGILDYGVGGSGVYDWDSTAYSGYIALKDGIGANDNELAGVFFLLGYNDASEGNIVSSANHASAIETIISNLEIDVGASLDWFVIGTQRGVGRSDNQWRMLREAEAQVYGAGPSRHYVCNSVDLEISGDNIHLSDAGYGIQGERCGAYIGELVSGRTPAETPQIIRLVATNLTTTTVELSVPSGTAEPTTGITGFELIGGTISSVDYVAPDEIHVTHDELAAGATLSYMYEANPDISGAFAVGGLPLEFSAVQAIPADVTIIPPSAATQVTAPDPAPASGAAVTTTLASTQSNALGPVVAAGANVTLTIGPTVTAAHDPVISAGAAAAPPAASTIVAAFSPFVGVATQVQPGPAAMVAAANDPVVVTGAGVTPAAARTTVTVLAPTASTGADVAPGPAGISCATLAPTVVAGIKEYRRVVEIMGSYYRRVTA